MAKNFNGYGWNDYAGTSKLTNVTQSVVDLPAQKREQSWNYKKSTQNSPLQPNKYSASTQNNHESQALHRKHGPADSLNDLSETRTGFKAFQARPSSRGTEQLAKSKLHKEISHQSRRSYESSPATEKQLATGSNGINDLSIVQDIRKCIAVQMQNFQTKVFARIETALKYSEDRQEKKLERLENKMDKHDQKLEKLENLQDKMEKLQKRTNETHIAVQNNHLLLSKFSVQIENVYNHLNNNIPAYVEHVHASNASGSPAREQNHRGLQARQVSKQENSLLKGKLEEETKKREQLEKKCKALTESLEALKKKESSSKPAAREQVYCELENVRPLFISNILNRYKGEDFLKESIMNFTSKKLRNVELVYQYDKYNKNIASYLNVEPFPYLILLETEKSTVFGVFGEGIESRVSMAGLQRAKPNFKAFMFSLNDKRLFVNERSSRVSSASFADSLLKFGNSEMVIRSNYPEKVKVNCGSIIGEVYYGIRSRSQLVGYEAEDVFLKGFELHRVSFQL